MHDYVPKYRGGVDNNRAPPGGLELYIPVHDTLAKFKQIYQGFDSICPWEGSFDILPFEFGDGNVATSPLYPPCPSIPYDWSP